MSSEDIFTRAAVSSTERAAARQHDSAISHAANREARANLKQFNVSPSAESASLDVQIGVKVHVNHKVNCVDIMTDFIYHIQFVVERFLFLPADY